MSLAIVIVAYNAVRDLTAALESLSAAPPSIPTGIVVVDNASTEDVPGLVRARFPGVTLIEAGANLGFARGVNLGVRNSTSEYVLLLNPDTTVPPGAIDRLVASLQQAPEVGAIGPRLVDAAGRAELSFGRMYSPLSELRTKLWLGMQARGVPFVQAAIERATSRARDVDWVSGACLLVRRLAGEAVGWLDERYFLYAEDVDFCAALRAAGWRVRFTPDVQVVHHRGRSGASRPDATRRAWHASHLAFYRKHRPRWAPWLERYLRWRGYDPTA
ncbi:MAG TPA: glycosyltransferase family 2 protein [Vicinamibacterales bacterium]